MSTSVEQFMILAPQLITEAAEYAGSGVSDPATDANIRQLRTMASALQSALMSINLPLMPFTPPPTPTAAPTKSS